MAESRPDLLLVPSKFKGGSDHYSLKKHHHFCQVLGRSNSYVLANIIIFIREGLRKGGTGEVAVPLQREHINSTCDTPVTKIVPSHW